jgi:hypothetical protein
VEWLLFGVLKKSEISVFAGLDSHRLTYVCGRVAGDVPGGQMIFHNVDSPRFLRCCGVSAPSFGTIVETDCSREDKGVGCEEVGDVGVGEVGGLAKVQ